MLVVSAPRMLFGRPINASRRLIIGSLLILQWPISIALSGAILGDTLPGPIDGAAPSEARDRFLASFSEYVFLITVYLICIGLWLSSKPATEVEQQIIRASRQKPSRSKRKLPNPNNERTDQT